MEVLVRGKRDINPFLFKAGVALSLSAAGYLASHLRSQYQRRPSSGTHAEVGGRGLKDALRILKNGDSLAEIINGTSTTTTTTTTTTKFVGVSPTNMSPSDGEGFLLPEFDAVLREFEAVRRKDASPTLERPEIRDETTLIMEHEIEYLRNLVRYLRERESNLELQLLEYYGLQEQEQAIRELENRLKIDTMEARIFSLKIESLQAENQRLHAQLSDCSKATTELDAARANVKSLKRKLKLDAEEAKESMCLLQRRISALQNKEEMDRRDAADAERRLKELECDASNLQMMNSTLAEENLELSRKLEASQDEALEVEVKHLREANKRLTNEIEQLQTDRCSDAEELVYLKWVNACLRYELRNYQPAPGKTVARDLSKTLSPKSEEKAKQLIVEYANSGADEKRLSPTSTCFDSEYCSSSRTSMGESDDTCNDSSSRNSNKANVSKSKFFRKLKKLVLGKDSPRNNFSTESSVYSDRRESFSTYSLDEMVGRDSYDSLSSCMTEEAFPAADEQLHRKPPQHNDRHSLDTQRIRRLKIDDEREGKGNKMKRMNSLNGRLEGKGYKMKRMDSLNERSALLRQTSSIDSEGTDSPEKLELKKFAEVLKSSHAMQRNQR